MAPTGPLRTLLLGRSSTAGTRRNSHAVDHRLHPPFDSLEDVDAVLAALDGPPEGMEARYVGRTTDGHLRIVSLWTSQQHAERFLNGELGAAVAKALGPERSAVAELVAID